MAACSTQEIVSAALKEFCLDTVIVPPTANLRQFLQSAAEAAVITALHCRTKTLPVALPVASTLCDWYRKRGAAKKQKDLRKDIARVRHWLENSQTIFLPVPVGVERSLRPQRREKLLEFLHRVNEHIQTKYRLQTKEAVQTTPASETLVDAFADDRKHERKVEYLSLVTSYLSSQSGVLNGISAVRDSAPVLLQPTVTEVAVRALPSASTATRWQRADDEHFRKGASELVANRPLVFTCDSGRKGNHNYFVMTIRCFISEENLVYKELLAVRLISDGTGAEMDEQKRFAFERGRLDERRVLWLGSDSASAMIGKQIGLLAHSRNRLSSPLASAPCVAHLADTAYQHGLTTMIGNDQHKYVNADLASLSSFQTWPERQVVQGRHATASSFGRIPGGSEAAWANERDGSRWTVCKASGARNFSLAFYHRHLEAAARKAEHFGRAASCNRATSWCSGQRRHCQDAESLQGLAFSVGPSQQPSYGGGARCRLRSWQQNSQTRTFVFAKQRGNAHGAAARVFAVDSGQETGSAVRRS